MELNLESHGFVAEDESWWLNTGDSQISIIAIGGKYSRPNALCRTVCVRSQLMRTQEEIVPTGMAREPLDYPVKLSPGLTVRFNHDRWVYESRLLDYPFGYLESQEQCDQLVNAIVEKLLPWAKGLTAESWLNQLTEHGKDGWIERLWIEDLKT